MGNLRQTVHRSHHQLRHARPLQLRQPDGPAARYAGSGRSVGLAGVGLQNVSQQASRQVGLRPADNTQSVSQAMKICRYVYCIG